MKRNPLIWLAVAAAAFFAWEYAQARKRAQQTALPPGYDNLYL